MFEFLSEVFKALQGYPIIQGSVALIVLLVGVTVMRRGEKDRKNGGGSGEQSIPTWLMMGPAHDAIGAIHEMNEQSRQTVELLRNCHAELNACRVSLELIRSESRLR